MPLITIRYLIIRWDIRLNGGEHTMPTMNREFRRTDEQPFRFQYSIFLLVLFAGISQANTDVVIFHNGDRLTAEVKSQKRGRLRFKTDATDAISIEWEDVAYLSSNQNIQVETDNGNRFLGHLVRSENEFSLIVETGTGPIELDNAEGVFMTPIEQAGVSRLDGDITAGYNFAKASEVTQINLGLDLDCRTETRIFSLNLDSVVTDSQDNKASQRQSLGLQYRRLLSNRWLYGGVITLVRNDELGINLRTSIGGGGGRILRQTNRGSLAPEGGLLASRENISGSVADEDTLEAFATMTWDWFRYDSPELDLSTSLQVIPNLTDTGRVRGELDVKLKWEMIEDLFWELDFYDSFDSRPVVTGAEKNDYGVITSLGWDF